MTSPLSYNEHWIPNGQGNVYARDYPGAGPTLVLMHGFPDNLRIYDDLIPYLTAAGRRVVTFDFLGFGASDKPVGRRTALPSSSAISRRWYNICTWVTWCWCRMIPPASWA